MPTDYSTASPVSLRFRFYMYALHGVLIEVLFTGIWHLLAYRHPALPGNTSLWSLLIYGVGGLGDEYLYKRLSAAGWRRVWRAGAYTAWTYGWELTCGLVLTAAGACPWDYTERRLNLFGLVTLEYLPCWYIGALFCDMAIPYLLRMAFLRKPNLTVNGIQDSVVLKKPM